MEIQTKVDLAGIILEHPVMNGAGTCKFLEGPEGVRRLVHSNAAAIMVGSMTIKQREGNIGETYWSGDGLSLNSRGLPNPGISYYARNLPEMVVLAHNANKPLFLSVAGFNPAEYALLSEFAFRRGADGTELDLGCGNIWENSQQNRIACFDPQLMEEILRCVEAKVGEKARVFVKLSPFSDPVLLRQVAGVIEKFRVVKAVTTSNTFPNALLFDEKGKPRITPGGGLAGLGGSALKPIILGQIKQLREVLPKNIAIVGCGGIAAGKDIRDCQLAGANAVQICTVLLQFGPEIFTRLLLEFTDTFNTPAF
jgi:dihydroorotate dehydrogenase (fumarate)